MTLLRSSQEDLVALAGEAADALGIPEPSFVEKDYWVVELLRSVMRPLELEPIDGRACSARALFKGGTSLSKVFGIIERFSEDLDILIVHEGLGESARENRVLRPICERARIDLGLSDDDTEVTERSTGVKRNVAFRYPQRLPSASISPTARLEMGIRGGTLPGVVHGTVRSYIAQYVASVGVDADFEELLPVEVEAIAPVRTLAEKVAPCTTPVPLRCTAIRDHLRKRAGTSQMSLGSSTTPTFKRRWLGQTARWRSLPRMSTNGVPDPVGLSRHAPPRAMEQVRRSVPKVHCETLPRRATRTRPRSCGDRSRVSTSVLR